MMLADDLLNCSEDYHTQLSKVLIQNYPNTWKLVESILDMVGYYDLNDSSQNLRFVRRVIRKLPLGDGWRQGHDVRGIRNLIQQASSNESEMIST